MSIHNSSKYRNGGRQALNLPERRVYLLFLPSGISSPKDRVNEIVYVSVGVERANDQHLKLVRGVC